MKEDCIAFPQDLLCLTSRCPSRVRSNKWDRLPGGRGQHPTWHNRVLRCHLRAVVLIVLDCTEQWQGKCMYALSFENKCQNQQTKGKAVEYEILIIRSIFSLVTENITWNQRSQSIERVSTSGDLLYLLCQAQTRYYSMKDPLECKELTWNILPPEMRTWKMYLRILRDLFQDNTCHEHL